MKRVMQSFITNPNKNTKKKNEKIKNKSNENEIIEIKCINCNEEKNSNNILSYDEDSYIIIDDYIVETESNTQINSFLKFPNIYDSFESSIEINENFSNKNSKFGNKISISNENIFLKQTDNYNEDNSRQVLVKPLYSNESISFKYNYLLNKFI